MEEEPTGTAETSKSTSSSLSQMTSKWLGLSLWDCFSEFIRHLRAFIFSASRVQCPQAQREGQCACCGCILMAWAYLKAWVMS